MNIYQKIAEELGIKLWQAEAAVNLIDEGNTIPFIARYRKEAHGSLDDEQLRNLYERLVYLRNLEEKKEQVLSSIEEQGKLTEELRAQITAAQTQVEVDDLYRPYRPKRRTRATIAKEKGLEGLSAFILQQETAAPVREEAEKYVKVGDCAMFEGNYQELAGRNVMAKAFDDRSACYVQLETLKAMKTPYHDVYFVFTVQEEVGLFGATTSAERIKPDLGIAIDITGSFDVPGDKHGNAVLGKGAAICISNACVTCDEDMVGQMVECAKEHQIPYQFDVLVNGGTDAGAINKSYRGVKAVGISIPTRYGHSPNSIINLDDQQSCIELLKVYVECSLRIVTEEVFK